VQTSLRAVPLSEALLTRLLPLSGAARDAVLMVAACLFVAAAAQVAIPLPFTPVPLTGQTFAVLLSGGLLGWRLGCGSLLLYLAAGAVGLPFYAQGRGGPETLVGPTAGYLLGFVLAAGVVGWLAQRGWDRSFPRAALAMAMGNLLIYALGVAVLSGYVGGLQPAVLRGVLPFLPGDLIKVLLAAGALPAGWALVGALPGPRPHDRAGRV